MLRFDRKQQNSIKQLSFNKIIIKKENPTVSIFKNFPSPFHHDGVFSVLQLN